MKNAMILVGFVFNSIGKILLLVVLFILGLESISQAITSLSIIYLILFLIIVFIIASMIYEALHT